MQRFMIFMALTIGLTACSSLERSRRSGYSDDPTMAGSENTVEEFYGRKLKMSWDEAKDQLGYVQGRTLTESEANAVKARVELNNLENTLSQEADKRQYYGYKPFFRSDADRVAFLRIPTREARERYARQKGLATEESKFDHPTLNLIESSDIGKGMSRGAVRQSWGEPDMVESAGNPLYGNERWVYTKLMSTHDGYKNEKRIVYFESGRVVGWETL